MGFRSAITETSQRPQPAYILASQYLRHCSGRFTSYFPNKTSYKLLPHTTLDQILNHTNLYHSVTSYFSKTHFNIIFPSMSGYSNLSSLDVLWSKCSMQSQTVYMCATCSVHLIFLDLFTAVIPWRGQILKFCHSPIFIVRTDCYIKTDHQYLDLLCGENKLNIYMSGVKCNNEWEKSTLVHNTV